MNKTLSAFALGAAILCSTQAFAADYELPETVGETDMTSGWGTAYSQYFAINKGEALTLNFTNYGGSANNWNNYVLFLTSDADRNAAGYVDHLVARADNYGWGVLYNNCVRTSNFNWDTFIADLANTDVTLTVNYSADGYIDMKATYTGASSSTNIVYTYSSQDALSDATIRAFLTVENSYLTINSASKSEATAHAQEEISAHDGEYSFGSTTTAFWGAFSDDYTIAAGEELNIEFVNTNSGTGNTWENFLMAFTSPFHKTRVGYEEYAVVRADSYGWGSNWNTNGADSKVALSNTYGSADIVSIMNGATVNLNVKFSEDKVLTFEADIKGSDNNDYTLTGAYSGTINQNAINFFLSVEKAQVAVKSAVVSEIGSSTTIKNSVSAADVANVEFYDLTGKKVSGNAKGAVIKVVVYADGSRKAVLTRVK